MISLNRILMAGGSFIVAGASGLYLQSSAPSQNVEVSQATQVAAQARKDELLAPDVPVGADVQMGGSMPSEDLGSQREASAFKLTDSAARADSLDELRKMADVPATNATPAQPVQMAALEGTTATDAAPATEMALDPNCTISLTAEVEQAAMVRLFLDAPCRKSERLTIQHEAMAFTAMTTKDGLLDVTVPALSETGIFYAFFGDSEGAMTDIAVPGINMYDRVAILWKGDSGLQLHAREFGADYGDNGHVWADVPGNADRAIQGQGGFVSTLGDTYAIEPQMAEIYTFPSGIIQDSGTVRLSVEAEITAANCGRDLEALSLQSDAGAPVEVVELSLSVPGCQTIGDFLVLNSLLRDLKVAGN